MRYPLPKDPPMKRGGKGRPFKCANCGDPLPSVCVADSDPFCRTECAREYHGTQITREKVVT